MPRRLVGLPLIEDALEVEVQRIVHAVPGREVKLASAGSDVRVQGTEQLEQIHVAPSVDVLVADDSFPDV